MYDEKLIATVEMEEPKMCGVVKGNSFSVVLSETGSDSYGLKMW